MNFDGYSIGGTSVGEDKETMYRMIDYSVKHLPAEKPRYLMDDRYIYRAFIAENPQK